MLICGVDEAGRGPLAGPVYAAAVILDPARPILGLDDSKKLSARKRSQLEPLIKANSLSWAVAFCTPAEIDEINILQASLLAMRRAIEALPLQAHEAWIDGHIIPGGLSIGAQAFIGGDALHECISAASILAKEERDRVMRAMDTQFPGYGFAKHSGYPVAAHLEALRRLGPCVHHRRSFKPVKVLLSAGPGAST